MLRSARLTFEPLAIAHASRLYDALNHPSVHQYIDATSYRSEAAITNFIERVNRGPDGESTDEWINIVCLLDDSLIGQVQATVHSEWAEIAFLFDPTFQGKGYASEAVAWLIDHLHDTRGIREFWATTVPENRRSIVLLNRTGFFEREALEREVLSYDPSDLVFRRNL